VNSRRCNEYQDGGVPTPSENDPALAFGLERK
jgi:hypothetical protein